LGQVQKKETNTMANASTVGFGLRTTMVVGKLQLLQVNLNTKSNQA
jgi:hypothetical protein